MLRQLHLSLCCAAVWLVAPLGDDKAAAQSSADPEDLKRILPASAAAEGSIEIGLFTEYSTLDFEYGVLGHNGEDLDFIADDFHTWTTELQFNFGIIEDFELELILPVIYAHFQSAENDRLSTTRRRQETAIGDAELLFSYGWESDDETLLALISLGAELPTNTLSDFFGGASTAGVGALEIEKYFGPVGIIGGFESIFGDDNDWEFEYLLGLAAIPNNRLYSQILFARFPEENLNRVEASIDYLLSDRYSLEWLISRELSGEQETIVGMGFTIFFGEEELDADDD